MYKRFTTIRHLVPCSLLAAALAAGLVGCGSFTGEGIDRSTVGVGEEDHIIQVMVEDFDQDYYDESELENMIRSAASYLITEKGREAVSLQSLERGDGKVTVRLQYDTPEDFALFNQETFFYGTISEAQQQGLTVPLNLYAPDGTQITASELADMGERHVILTSDKSDLALPGKAAYYSRGIQVTDGKTADLSAADEDIVCVILTK